MRDIFRDAVQRDQEPGRGLGTAIAALFIGIGLKENEHIRELRGFALPGPVRHPWLRVDRDREAGHRDLARIADRFSGLLRYFGRGSMAA